MTALVHLDNLLLDLKTILKDKCQTKWLAK